MLVTRAATVVAITGWDTQGLQPRSSNSKLTPEKKSALALGLISKGGVPTYP